MNREAVSGHSLQLSHRRLISCCERIFRRSECCTLELVLEERSCVGGVRRMSLRKLALALLICALGTTLATRSRFIPVVASVKNAAALQEEKAKVAGQKTPEEIQAKYKAHQHDFDYLLGDWEFTAVNRNGKFRGLWSAVRLPETGQIMDEFRVVSDTGETWYVSTTW